MLCVRDFVGGSDQAGKIVTHTLSVVSAVVDPNHRIPTGLDESELGSKVPFVKVYLFDRHPRLTYGAQRHILPSRLMHMSIKSDCHMF